MNNRNTLLDIIKGVGIILVVLGHNWVAFQGSAELFRVIFSFHIPLFLFISGLVIKESDQIRVFVVKRADALLKPYFFILILLGILSLFNLGAQLTNQVPSQIIFLGALYATGKTLPWVWGPLWYLPHLFITSLASLTILKATRERNQRAAWILAIAVICLVLGVQFLTAFWAPLPGLPFSLDIALVSTAYILFGFLFKRRIHQMNFHFPTFMLAVATFAITHYFFNESIDLNMRYYGNLTLSLLQSLLGIYIILSVSIILNRYHILRRAMAYIGSSSLFILIFHYIFQHRMFSYLESLGYSNSISAAISFAAGIGLPLMIMEIVKRQRILAVVLLPHKIKRPSQRIAFGGDYI